MNRLVLLLIYGIYQFINIKVLLLIKSFVVDKKITQKAVNNAVFGGSLK